MTVRNRLRLALTVVLVTALGCDEYAFIPVTVLGVSVVNVRTKELVTTIPLPDYTGSHGIAVSPSGGRVYVAAHHNRTKLWVLDGVAHKLVQTLELPWNCSSMGVAVRPDHRRVYVACYNGYVLTYVRQPNDSLQLLRTEFVDASWNGAVAAGVNGNRVYVASANGSLAILDADSGAQTGSVFLDPECDTTSIAFDPVSGQAYATCLNAQADEPAVYRIDCNDSASVFKRFGQASKPWGVAVGRNGDHVFVTKHFLANETEGRLVRMSTTLGNVTKDLSAGITPTAVNQTKVDNKYFTVVVPRGSESIEIFRLETNNNWTVPLPTGTQGTGGLFMRPVYGTPPSHCP